MVECLPENDYRNSKAYSGQHHDQKSGSPIEQFRIFLTH